MSNPRKLYWDSSCFICFLNKDEKERRLICEDILRSAQAGLVEIWTSAWTIAEVIRPKEKFAKRPLPAWSDEISEKVPNVLPEVEKLWHYFVKRTTPARQLSPQDVTLITMMFKWDYIRIINVDERIANEAVSIARSLGLKPADSVHAASAIARKCDALQRWDRDFDKVKKLIAVEDPVQISPQGFLPIV